MDLKEIALRRLNGAFNMMRKDLEALPEDAFDKNFGEATRTVADLVYEVDLVNDHVCMVMRGDKPFDWPEEQWITAPDGFRTKDAVLNGYEKSSQGVIETVEGFTEDQMAAPLMTDNGETTRFDRCMFMALHVWYHSGQFNYVQTILGDDQMHWG